MKAVAFTGNSNSGKTTLIQKLILLLTPQKSVSIIKHDPKNKANIDTEGKDSDIFYKAGANVAILSPIQTTFRFHHSFDLDKAIQKFEHCDYLFVEGLKEIPLPRICVAREMIDERFFPYIDAVAIDSSISKDSIPKHLAILNLNQPQEILEWINANIKDYK